MLRKFFSSSPKSTQKRRFLVYKNRFDEVKPYEVEILISHGDTLEVLDINAAKDKTFLKDNILGEYSSFVEAERQSIRKQKHYKIRTPVKMGANMGNPSSKAELCFTGFRKAEKIELISLAENKGFFIRSDVSGGLTALICGENPGPSKMKRAVNNGAAIVKGKTAFLRFLETGEIK